MFLLKPIQRMPLQRLLSSSFQVSNHSSCLKWQSRSFSSFQPTTNMLNRTTWTRHYAGKKGNINVLGDFSARGQSCGGVDWLWEVDDETSLSFNEANENGTRTGGFMMTFNSKLPLTSEHFLQVSEDIKRKCPNVRSVYRKRGDATWLCQLQNSEVDFKVLKNEETFEEDCWNDVSKGFKEPDSLSFKSRVIEQGPAVSCNIEGVREQYPYQYNYFYTVNHSLTDGIDSLYVVRLIHQSLESQMAGKSLSPDEIGVFEKNKELPLILAQRREELIRNPGRVELIRNILPKITDIPSILEAFPRPEVDKVTTKHLERNLDSQLTKALLSLCSEKGVTFNSLCVTITNVALVELMKEAGLNRDSYKIACLMFVNLRRYLTSKKHVVGPYLSGLTYISEVNADIRKSFWDYCRRVNHELKMNYADDANVLDQMIVQKMIDSELGHFNYTDNPRPVCHDYSISNVGDITKLIQGTGEYVQLTNVKFQQALHNYKNALTQSICTFRGKTQYNFCYANNHLSDETAKSIADKVIEIAKSITK